MTALLTPPRVVRATIDDLYKVDGKAELIGGRIVKFMATGIQHTLVAVEVYISLRRHEKTTRSGTAFPDVIGYRMPELSSGRESFSPDASFFAGPVDRKDPKFVDGPPTFAVEVRSPDDYGPAAEREMAAKRDDYFEAGTLAVWDVDPDDETVTLYESSSPQKKIIFARGDVAHAGVAVPGWSMTVDEILDAD
jgi:Uma2 family endonuclease